MSDQPGLPGIPDAPEVPQVLVWGRWLVHHLLGDPAVLIKTWRPILLATAALGVAIYYWEKSVYENRIQNLETAASTDRSTITNQQVSINQYQEELKGTSPQLAAIQAGRDKVRTQLQQYYVEAGGFLDKPMASKDEAGDLSKQINTWGAGVATWVQKNLGTAAAMRVFDPETQPSLSWGQCKSQECNNLRDWLLGVRRNLSTLIETAAWDGAPAHSEVGQH